jgi:hypothetical protein
MVEIRDPFTKEEIIDSLRQVNQTLTDYCTGLSPEVFFAHPPGVWSPAENVEHLILAITPRIEILLGQHETLKEHYGPADKPSRHYAEIRETYRNILANGGAAGPSSTPQIDDHPEDPKAAQDALMERWHQTSHALVSAAEHWTEVDLDALRVESRLLGLLTVRELLRWMIYHNLHHLEDAQAQAAIASQPGKGALDHPRPS